jgi:hypothetical protein
MVSSALTSMLYPLIFESGEFSGKQPRDSRAGHRELATPAPHLSDFRRSSTSSSLACRSASLGCRRNPAPARQKIDKSLLVSRAFSLTASRGARLSVTLQKIIPSHDNGCRRLANVRHHRIQRIFSVCASDGLRVTNRHRQHHCDDYRRRAIPNRSVHDILQGHLI